MRELEKNNLALVHAAAATMRGNVFTVTDNSVINLAGIKFTANGICENEICSQKVFAEPIRYAFAQNFVLNGKNVFMIEADRIENGAVYYLHGI